MYSNENEQASKKKYLVPLVALLICGMAFVGSAYAYSSSIQTTSDLQTEYYEITLDGKDTYTFTDKLAFDAVKVDGKVTYTAEKITKTVKVAMDKDKKNGTDGFTIESATVTIKDADENVVSGLSGALVQKTKNADGSYDMELTISGKLAENAVPEDSYKVTIVIKTNADNKQADA